MYHELVTAKVIVKLEVVALSILSDSSNLDELCVY